MPWSRKLAKLIVLKDGRTIATLGDAREMILSVPAHHRSRVVWQSAADLLNEAAAYKDLVPDAEEQLSRALKAEGLI